MSSFMLIAKAGGSSEAAENTCEAVSRAARLPAVAGVQLAIEVDLRLSAEHRLVALHDARLERTTDGRGLVRQHGVQELSRLRAGHDGERVPTLLEVAEAAGDCPLLLDLHDDDVVAAAAVCRELARLGPSRKERFWVASEHGRVVEAVRRLDPMLRTAATKREAWNKLLLGWLGLGRLASRGHVWIVPDRHAGLPIVTRRFVEQANEAGDSVWVFVVNDVLTVTRLRGLGVSGWVTTRPAHLLASLAAS